MKTAHNIHYFAKMCAWRTLLDYTLHIGVGDDADLQRREAV